MVAMANGSRNQFIQTLAALGIFLIVLWGTASWLNGRVVACEEQTRVAKSQTDMLSLRLTNIEITLQEIKGDVKQHLADTHRTGQ